ncbi:hypothetical protein BJ085DRAFT_29465 [Dimargaris cristalligena]|uniref:Uncharacterized protein n=1 Tax=Dimargaris cristalligena TaxID=215637 RepID=A0A4P9ZV14_9FUNG|nr:hypothetical protein BJ085DRAFT_29465 [Dimargaris cristalligena]|eukprot:RKP37403.1 hypothetical protein BJ085DRAFT_29465 [Dimargaris cristalligena]
MSKGHLSDSFGPLQGRSWDELRRQVRTLSSSIDQNLARFHQLFATVSNATDSLSSTGGIGGGGPPSYSDVLSAAGGGDEFVIGGGGLRPSSADAGLAKTEEELDLLYDQLQATVRAMARIQESGGDTPAGGGSRPSSAMLHTLQRSRDMELDYGKEIQRAKDKVHSYRQRADLLSGGGLSSGEPRDDVQSLLHERDRIDHSHQMIDMTLGQAYAVRGDLDEQRSMLSRSMGRIGLVLVNYHHYLWPSARPMAGSLVVHVVSTVPAHQSSNHLPPSRQTVFRASIYFSVKSDTDVAVTSLLLAA